MTPEARLRHRRSIRLKGYDYAQPGAYFVTLVTWQRLCLFGEVVNGEMRLNDWGFVASNEWRRLASRFETVEIAAFVVMPNHLHAILTITAPVTPVGAGPIAGAGPIVGAGQEDAVMSGDSSLAPPLRTPPLQNEPPQRSTDENTPPIVRAGQERSIMSGDSFFAPPLQNEPSLPVLGTIIGAYKSTTARLINGLRRTPGAPLWQRNYYEHILRDEKELARIHAYINANPASWGNDEENR